MIRKTGIAICLKMCLIFCVLATYAHFDVVYHVRELSPQTTAYFSIIDGMLHVGWFTGTAPVQAVSEIDGKSIHVSIEWGYSSDSHPVTPAPGPKAFFPIAIVHHLNWNVPIYFSPIGTVYATRFRTWIGTPIVAFALGPLVALTSGPVRRWHRRRRGLCVRCGYNLVGNTSGVCPECGTRSAW